MQVSSAPRHVRTAREKKRPGAVRALLLPSQSRRAVINSLALRQPRVCIRVSKYMHIQRGRSRVYVYEREARGRIIFSPFGGMNCVRGRFYVWSVYRLCGGIEEVMNRVR